MTRPGENTRNHLLITAGTLFADYGYDGVGTRMIAERAAVKLSAIHYHFGSKENLYVEAFKQASQKGAGTNFTDVLAENPALAGTREGQAEIVRNTVFRRFHDYFKPDRPAWERQILVRECMNPSSALPVLAEQLFKPDVEAAATFYFLVRPDGTAQEAAAWGDLFQASLYFYTMAREPLVLVRGAMALDPEFLSQAARTISRAMILEAGLPLPPDLR